MTAELRHNGAFSLPLSHLAGCALRGAPPWRSPRSPGTAVFGTFGAEVAAILALPSGNLT